MRYGALYQRLLDETVAADIAWGRLRGARVMITGATGLIGSFLVDLLMARNARFDGQIAVTACARGLEAGRARFAPHAENPNFELIQYDVTRPFPGQDEFDYIVHAASNASPAAFSSDPVGTLTGILEGTRNMLELVRDKRARRVLFISTGEIYGRLPPEEIPTREQNLGWIDLMSPRSAYPSGKRAAETLVSAYHAQYGVDGVIARLCHVYGPTASARDNRAATQFLMDAAAGRDILMKSPGQQVRSYLHVADCALAILTVLLEGATARAYNVASPDSVLSIADFADLCARAGGARVTFQLPDDAERRGYAPEQPQILDASALSALGFSARFAPEEGIRSTVDILRQGLYA